MAFEKALRIGTIVVFSAASASAADGANGTREELPAPIELLKTLKGRKHPYLVFSDFQETTASRNGSSREWLVRSVVSTVDRLKGGAVSDVALCWLVTKDRKFLEMCLGYLKSMRKPDLDLQWGAQHGEALASSALAYDWVAEALDSEGRKQVEDALARYADELYQAAPRWDNAWHHIVGGMALGMAACVAPDHDGNTRSKPVDWLSAATTWMFESNPHQLDETTATMKCEKTMGPFWMAEHGKRAGLNRTANPGGYDRRGGYRFQWAVALAEWAAVYSRVFGRNMLDDYPLVRKYMHHHLWSSMPNGGGSCAGIGDGRRWSYAEGVLHLMTEEERQSHLWYLRSFRNGRCDNMGISVLKEGAGLARPSFDGKGRPPSWTTFVSAQAEHVVFRKSWEPDSDWLMFICEDYCIPRAREAVHHDNMSFELYARGDYLLSDGGEVRGRGSPGYGPTGGGGHNLVLIDGTGPAKGIRSFVTPAVLMNSMTEPWREMADAEIDVKFREDPNKNYENLVPVNPPVRWRRSILYPGKEYFVVADALASEKPHRYEWLFHLSSLNLVPTDKKPGHVIGDLAIGEQDIPWSKDVAARVVYEKGSEEKPHWMSPVVSEGEYLGAAIRWRTKSIPTWAIDTFPYYSKGQCVPDSCSTFDPATRKNVEARIGKRDVELKMVFAPTPKKISVQRTWGIHHMRDPWNYEVDHPLFRFQKEAKDAFSMVALLPRYPDEEQERQAAAATVTGEGCAMKVGFDRVTDLVGVSKGNLEFEKVCTDAELCLVRQKADKLETAMILRGWSLAHNGQPVISAEGTVAHAAFHFLEKEILGHVNLEKPAQMTIRCYFGPNTVTYQPDPDDWIWVWTEALRARHAPRPLRWERRADVLVIECPKGAGKVAVR
ncbi:MAG: heparinase II/III family protein [Planctomycetes bacterium]|nr:heparinase II/III family protein [Planctomycetota bacterium]